MHNNVVTQILPLCSTSTKSNFALGDKKFDLGETKVCHPNDLSDTNICHKNQNNCHPMCHPHNLGNTRVD